jgi:hypothetical protein
LIFAVSTSNVIIKVGLESGRHAFKLVSSPSSGLPLRVRPAGVISGCSGRPPPLQFLQARRRFGRNQLTLTPAPTSPSSANRNTAPSGAVNSFFTPIHNAVAVALLNSCCFSKAISLALLILKSGGGAGCDQPWPSVRSDRLRPSVITGIGLPQIIVELLPALRRQRSRTVIGSGARK